MDRFIHAQKKINRPVERRIYAGFSLQLTFDKIRKQKDEIIKTKNKQLSGCQLNGWRCRLTDGDTKANLNSRFGEKAC